MLVLYIIVIVVVVVVNVVTMAVVLNTFFLAGVCVLNTEKTVEVKPKI